MLKLQYNVHKPLGDLRVHYIRASECILHVINILVHPNQMNLRSCALYESAFWQVVLYLRATPKITWKRHNNWFLMNCKWLKKNYWWIVQTIAQLSRVENFTSFQLEQPMHSWI